MSFAKAYLEPGDDVRRAFVVRRIVVELCRYLAKLEAVAESQFEAPITVFVSHAKADIEREPKVTKRLIECLREDQSIEAWVIQGTSPPLEVCRHHQTRSKRTSLIAVLMDTYATREWCREEILLAKEHQRPGAD